MQIYGVECQSRLFQNGHNKTTIEVQFQHTPTVNVADLAAFVFDKIERKSETQPQAQSKHHRLSLLFTILTFITR